MSDAFIVSSIFLGILGIILLFIAAIIGQRAYPSLGEGMTVFLAGAAICPGLRVCFLSVYKPSSMLNTSDNIYIFLGGLAIIWVSIETIKKELQSKPSASSV